MHFSSIQLVPFCLVLFSSVCSFQFVNKWIYSLVEQLDQEEAAAKINSFTCDRQLTKLVVATCLLFSLYKRISADTNALVTFSTKSVLLLFKNVC